MNFIFLSGNVPSSKNSKIWTGRFLVSSKACQHYEKETKMEWLVRKNDFHEIFSDNKKPLSVGMYFVRKSKHKFDYINACQILADLMVTNGWISDDDADNFVPVFLGYHHEPKNAGVYLVKLPESLKTDQFVTTLISEIKS